MNELTQRGIASLKAGDRTAARQLLAAAVKQDPNDALAWLWLTGTVNSDDERIACLRQVLRIDPGNQPAARGLAQILERRKQPAAEPAAPPAAQAPASQPESSPGHQAESSAPEPQPQAIESLRAMAAMNTPPAEEPPAADVLETPPAVALASSKPAPAPQPARKRTARSQGDASGQLVFRSRPSLVPALICFWLFLIGAIVIGALLGQNAEVGLLLSAGLGLILELIVLYAIIRTLAVRYELTSQQLTLRFQGKRARVPVSDIYNAEMKQSIFQRMLGIGDIDIDAAVNGQLAHLRMRNIPQCRLRADQIMHLVREHGPA